MKGQTQAVTAVMITGVVVGGIASAYVWGVPLIDKRQGQSELRSLESSIVDLEQSIVSVSQAGQGDGDEVSMELDNGEVFMNESGNYIDITTYGESAPYPAGTWRLLRGQSLQGLSIGAGDYGIQGENTPGIVAVRRESASTSEITYRVEFRNLRTTTPTGPELRQIDIQSQGANRATEDVTFEFTNNGRRADSGSSAVDLSGGETIDRRRTVVDIDLR
jgi:hypothetical protein